MTTIVSLRQELERRGLLAEVWKFDLLARARRPWRVSLYPVTIAPSRSQPEQMQMVYDAAAAQNSHSVNG